MRLLNWNPVQLQILKSPSKRIFAHGGFRAGKSVAMLYKVTEIALCEPGSKILIGREQLTDLKKDTFSILFDKSDGLWVGLGEFNKVDNHFQFYNGSEAWFAHFDDPDSLKGPTLSVIYIEQAEQVGKEVFDVLLSRLSLWGNEDDPHSPYQQYIKKFKNQKGYIKTPGHYFYMTANPSPCWLKDHFIDKQPEGWEVVSLPTYVNLQNLPKEYLKDQIRDNSEYYIKRFLEGSWDVAKGLVYPEFRMETHVVPVIKDYNKYFWKRICSIDPGYQHPTAVIFAAIDFENNLVIYDEIYEREKTPKQICDLIHLKNGAHGCTPNIYLIDSQANTVNKLNAKTEADLYRENKIPVINADKQVRAGILRLKSKFKLNGVKIFPHCLNLIRELQTYIWDERNPEHPVKENDDAVDALRYIANRAFGTAPHVVQDPSKGKEMTAQMVSRWIWEKQVEPNGYLDITYGV